MGLHDRGTHEQLSLRRGASWVVGVPARLSLRQGREEEVHGRVGGVGGRGDRRWRDVNARTRSKHTMPNNHLFLCASYPRRQHTWSTRLRRARQSRASPRRAPACNTSALGTSDTHNASGAHLPRCGRSTRHTQRLQATTTMLRAQHATHTTPADHDRYVAGAAHHTPDVAGAGATRRPAETGLTPRLEGARTMTHQYERRLIKTKGDSHSDKRRQLQKKH